MRKTTARPKEKAPSTSSKSISTSRVLLHGGGFLGEHFADAFDLRADSLELLFNIFVAAVDVVDAVDDGFAVGDQGGEDERSRGAEIAGQDGGGAEGSLAADDGAATFDFYVGSHADQFLSVHETVFENIFGDDRRAFGLREQGHELGLAVGGEAGMLFGGHIGGGERIVAHDADGIGGEFGLDADFVKFAEERAQVRGIASGDVEIASGHGAGDDEGSGLDAVGNDAVFRAFQFRHTHNANRRRAGAFDFGSH